MILESRHVWSISMVQRLRYHATNWRACSTLPTRCVVSRRHCAGAWPAGGPTSFTSTTDRLSAAARSPATESGRRRLTVPNRSPHRRLPRRLGAANRHVDRVAALLLPACAARGQRRAVSQHTVMHRAAQQVHIGGPAGEQVIDVALAVGDHGNHRRLGQHIPGGERSIQPSAGFFLVCGSFVPIGYFAFSAINDGTVHQADDAAGVGVHRQRGVQEQARIDPRCRQCRSRACWQCGSRSATRWCPVWSGCAARRPAGRFAGRRRPPSRPC